MTSLSPEPNETAPESKSGPLDPGLYLVATPIGNLGDVTLRALAVLAKADLVACEDTRVTRKLLSAHGLSPRLTAYHDHSDEKVADRLLEAVAAGKVVALVSDAGSPLIADPGFALVAAARARGLLVTVVPGANAAIAALQLSGLPSERFFFAGFLSAKSGQRRQDLADLKAVPATLIFYEAPHRLAESLADMATALGPRAATVVREITKFFEEARSGTLETLAAHYSQTEARGEIVVVVAPPAAQQEEATLDLDAALRQALGQMSLRDAVDAVAGATGVKRREVYARALALTPHEP